MIRKKKTSQSVEEEEECVFIPDTVFIKSFLPGSMPAQIPQRILYVSNNEGFVRGFVTGGARGGGLPTGPLW